jgi:hypothetical protein
MRFSCTGFAQYGQAYSIPLDLDSRMSLAVSMWNAMLPSVVAVALCGMLPLSWICFHKLRLHKLMLEQMDNFDLRNAECSMESDREIIQEQVLDLFDEALEPPLHVAFGAEAGWWFISFKKGQKVLQRWSFNLYICYVIICYVMYQQLHTGFIHHVGFIYHHGRLSVIASRNSHIVGP